MFPLLYILWLFYVHLCGFSVTHSCSNLLLRLIVIKLVIKARLTRWTSKVGRTRIGKFARMVAAFEFPERESFAIVSDGSVGDGFSSVHSSQGIWRSMKFQLWLPFALKLPIEFSAFIRFNRRKRRHQAQKQSFLFQEIQGSRLPSQISKSEPCQLSRSTGSTWP